MCHQTLDSTMLRTEWDLIRGSDDKNSPITISGRKYWEN